MSGADDENQPLRMRRFLTEEQRSHRRERAKFLRASAAKAKREARARETPEQSGKSPESKSRGNESSTRPAKLSANSDLARSL